MNRTDHENQIALCAKCRNERGWLPFSAFNWRNKEKKQLQIYCKECNIQASRDWYTNNGRKYRTKKEKIKNFGTKNHGVPRPITFDKQSSGCIYVTSHTAKASGYPRINKKLVSHIVYEEKYGPLEPGYVLRHNCDNPLCVNLEHIVSGTHADNVQDRVERDRSAKGEYNGRSKLTETQAVEIIANKIDSNPVLAAKYGVNRKTIKLIRDGKTWAYLPR